MPTEAPAVLEWPPARKVQVDAALARYPNKRSAVLPVLWEAQREWGWISPGAMRLVARTVDLPESEVFGIATFYTMFNLKPVGRHHLQVCMTLSCSLMGADRLFKHLERKLGIGHGETTADGRYTLRRVECLAACGMAPCMQVNLDYHENLNEASVDTLLEKLK
ncbi:MAG: NADH-quinone oxidoreductase subunit NuoE [Candidatus Eisenbacteria bacterium]|uniref:NADH-quinone oxidoreductase subunit NuoE n=1 Tax=Eiseniibacteriota bacterium TaxID=2212470 RepID=A0A849SQ27_UNCEI|nr:NADH-quinone oxidoreductase subunit NuoE [Candidatus Eisenbacteria bacterium]